MSEWSQLDVVAKIPCKEHFSFAHAWETVNGTGDDVCIDVTSSVSDCHIVYTVSINLCETGPCAYKKFDRFMKTINRVCHGHRTAIMTLRY